ncbi:MAG: L,D-transpeptidase, partial [Chloroflexi bacterium]|nr:L,D-transpeptidase [Chloroflexota bacterium]
PFAIILDKTGIYASLEPVGPRSPDSGYVTRRYELVHIYARSEDSAGHVWYLVGPRRWLRQEFVAKFAPIARPQAVTGRWMAVDLFEQTLIAYEGDAPVFATIISSGMPDWPTREGIFHIWARLETDSMRSATGAPDAYALEQVPWVMYFDGDISLHGSYWHDDFGYRRSHGCVNLSISDARWLYQWTAQDAPDAAGQVVNNVLVHSSGVYAAS